MTEQTTITRVTPKDLSARPQRLAGGHRLCAGCVAPVVVRQVLMAIDEPVVVANATGCLEVGTSIFPYTSWRIPWIHSAFENAAATIAGVEAMYQSLKRQGKLPVDREIRFLAFGGDGGTYDIGLQALSGAMERGHRMIYVCYDNGAYMNTGIQRSSSTPMGASTTTSPSGKVIPGKQQKRKDLTAIMVAHNIPYVAQASPANWRDLVTKVRKAAAVDGPAFLNIISTCHRGWRSKPDESIENLRLAVDTCFWPLFAVVDGKYTITYEPKEKRPVAEWLKLQGRFKHLFRPENQALLDRIQKDIDDNWEHLKSLAAMNRP
jgi:pyruvate ferredoxin oxidoreductase beta subunit